MWFFPGYLIPEPNLNSHFFPAKSLFRSWTLQPALRNDDIYLQAKICNRSFRSRGRAEHDGTRAETRFRLSHKRTRPFKSAGESVQSTAGSRGVPISVSNAGYTMFRGRVRVLATHSIRQFPLHFPSRASPCATTFRMQYTTKRKLWPLQWDVVQIPNLTCRANHFDWSTDFLFKNYMIKQ